MTRKTMQYLILAALAFLAGLAFAAIAGAIWADGGADLWRWM